MKNQDGLEAGQEVDFKTLMLIKRKEKATDDDKPKARPRTKKSKVSPTD